MVTLSPAVEQTLRAFVDAVRDSPHNLVSRRAKQELWDRHIQESIAFACTLPEDASVLDVGSGGGFPGLVVAVVRDDLQVTLLDSSAKKVGFLTGTARALDIDVRVLHGRAETIASASGAASFDIVTARAVAPMQRLLGWTMPFLRPGGQLHAIKGASWAEELTQAAKELQRWNGRVVATPDGSATDKVSPLVVVVERGGAQ